MAMGCISPLSERSDERLAWYRLLDAIEGREPRQSLTDNSAALEQQSRKPMDKPDDNGCWYPVEQCALPHCDCAKLTRDYIAKGAMP